MKWLRVVLLVCALPVPAETVVLGGLGNKPQELSQWCWAAVSEMAIRSFPQQGGFHHLNQVEVYAHRFQEVTTLAQELDPDPVKRLALKEKIDGTVAFCKAHPTECNSREQPLLFDIESDSPKDAKALTMEAFVRDIKDQGHPVVIQWSYRPASCGRNNARPSNPPSSAMKGTHALIVTGYNTDTNELRIFDPLPVRSPRNISGAHVRWIPFEAYIDPGSHEGLAVVALHTKDKFRMRRAGVIHPVSLESYEMTGAPPTCPQQPAPGGFEPEGALQGSIDRYVKNRKGGFPRSDGSRRTGTISTGTPIPVIALAADRLLGGEPLEQLLVSLADAYVVPVLEDKSVVDSFLLLPEHGGWRQGGYSNNQIALLLGQLSVRYKDKLRNGEVFYLVSIPEMASYFIAYGFQGRAMFLSLDYEGSGTFVPAKRAVEGVIAQFRRGEERPVIPKRTKVPTTSQ
jgi:hypothetical protein